MTRTELAAELSGVERLLREHAFLRYSEAGRAEYDQKLRTASGMFAAAVSRAANAAVPNPFPYASVEGLQAGGPDAVARAVHRVAARLSVAAARSKGREAVGLSSAAEAWRAASGLVAALPR